MLFTSCALDVRRQRFGRRLPEKPYAELAVGETKLDEALDKLGAPDLIERENDDEEDHLWWLHKDAADINIRLQLPLSYFGYRHNVFQYFQGDAQTNKIHLIFDESGTLLQKDFILPEEYAGDIGPEPPDRWHFTPRFEYGLVLDGSADVADFDEIFERGGIIGFDVNYQPVAPLVLGFGGSYQHYSGDTIQFAGGTFSFDDLELLNAEALIRLQLPFEVFSSLFDYAEVRRILLDEDPRNADGWLVFLEGGAGVVYNNDVGVQGPGPAANFFESGIGLSSVATIGVEYSWETVSVRAGFGVRSNDAFEEGDALIPDDAQALRVWTAVISVALKI